MSIGGEILKAEEVAELNAGRQTANLRARPNGPNIPGHRCRPTSIPIREISRSALDGRGRIETGGS